MIVSAKLQQFADFAMPLFIMQIVPLFRYTRKSKESVVLGRERPRSSFTDNIFIPTVSTSLYLRSWRRHAFMRYELIFSMRMREYDVYFLDNTHLQRWEYLDAVREAMLEHISVFVWDLREGPNYGNIHGVPEDRVKKMLDDSDKFLPFSHREVLCEEPGVFTTGLEQYLYNLLRAWLSNTRFCTIEVLSMKPEMPVNN